MKNTCLHHFYRSILIVSIMLLSTVWVSSQIPVPERGFISSEYAKTWQQGLISGNGTLGANVLSRPLDEIVILTHEQLYLPMGQPFVPVDQSNQLSRIRKLIDQGLYRQALHLQYVLTELDDFYYSEHFVPAFDLNVTMNTETEIRDYIRSVDFQTGESLVHWADKKGSYERRLFVSRADNIVVLQITGSERGSIDCELSLNRRIPSDKLAYNYLKGSYKTYDSHVGDVSISAKENILTYQNSFTKSYPGSIQIVEGMAYVNVRGGQTRNSRKSIVITGADEVLILMDMELLYDPNKSQFDKLEQDLSSVNADYDELLERHSKIHGEMFNRMKLDVGGGKDHELTTEQLIESSTEEEMNLALIEKQFDAGRYNIISSTGELPPNLQGIWAGHYFPDWGGVFVHDGNLPAAVSSNLMGNNPELMLAYVNHIESLIPDFEINARNFFGCRGIVVPFCTSTTGYNNACYTWYGGGFLISGAPWAAHFFYDYYQYTGDEKYLKEHALPFMEKTAVFFEDFLYEGPDGNYIFSPSTSSENGPSNVKSQGTFNATIDIQLVKELFTNLISVYNHLGIKKEKAALYAGMLRKMPEYMIDKEGFFKEWLTPLLDNNQNHRHTSHLYAIFDGMPPEIENSPEFQESMKKIIDFKLHNYWRGPKGKGMSFGIVQLGMASASLGEGELVHECLKHLVNRFWLSNMASMHDVKTQFNTDISGGMPAVIIRSLVISDPGRIRLLPALPSIWPEGEIQGVLCRGQIEVKSLKWTTKGLNVNLISQKKQTISLEVYGKKQNVNLPSGKLVSLSINK